MLPGGGSGGSVWYRRLLRQRPSSPENLLRTPPPPPPPPSPRRLQSLIFAGMLTDTYLDEHPGIRITYRTEGHLNSRRLEAPARLPTIIVHGLFFADDQAVNTTTEEDVQRNMTSSPQSAPTST
nr:unnamed protein product [Spirometra erinaceieuropaei]